MFFPATSRYLIRLTALIVIYFYAARFGLGFEPVSGFATFVWPPTGLAFAALLLFGRKYWPSIFIGAALANWSIGAPFFVALGIGVGNMLEAYVGVWVLEKYFRFEAQLGRLRDAVAYIVIAAFASTTIAASVGVFSLSLGGNLTPGLVSETWIAWWVGDALGALVVTPLILAGAVFLRNRHTQVREERFAEALTLTAILVTLDLAVFTDIFGEVSAFPIIYLVLVPLVWAALRFGQAGGSLAVFMTACIAVWGTVLGVGPFVQMSISESLFFLQIFMAVASVTTLLVGSIATEREESEEKFKKLLENSYDAVAVIDENAKNTYASPSMERVLGYTPAEFTSMRDTAEVHPEDKKAAAQVITSALQSPREPIFSKVRYKHKDGSWRWLESACVNLLDDPHVSGIVCNYRDVTDRETWEESIRRKDAELERINKLMVGRELRLLELKKEIARLKGEA